MDVTKNPTFLLTGAGVALALLALVASKNKGTTAPGFAVSSGTSGANLTAQTNAYNSNAAAVERARITDAGSTARANIGAQAHVIESLAAQKTSRLNVADYNFTARYSSDNTLASQEYADHANAFTAQTQSYYSFLTGKDNNETVRTIHAGDNLTAQNINSQNANVAMAQTAAQERAAEEQARIAGETRRVELGVQKDMSNNAVTAARIGHSGPSFGSILQTAIGSAGSFFSRGLVSPISNAPPRNANPTMWA